MRKSSITCWHAGHYTIMGQPQPGCFNCWHACHTTYYTHIITWFWGHTIHIIPCKNELGVERILPRGMKRPLSTECNGGREIIDRIYRFAMKISLDWSNQADSGSFIMSLIFTRSITLTIATGTSEKTATHDSDPSVQSLSPDGDSSRYGQVVRTIEKDHEPISSHHDAINSYRSHAVHQSIHRIWTDCKTLNKSISLYAHPDQKLNMIALIPLLGNRDATLATAFSKDLM